MSAPKYIDPQFNPEQLVDARACFARAQRALELAEVNLENVLTQVNGQLTTAESLAHVDVRARIGEGWAALAAALRGYR